MSRCPCRAATPLARAARESGNQGKAFRLIRSRFDLGWCQLHVWPWHFKNISLVVPALDPDWHLHPTHEAHLSHWLLLFILKNTFTLGTRTHTYTLILFKYTNLRVPLFAQHLARNPHLRGSDARERLALSQRVALARKGETVTQMQEPRCVAVACLIQFVLSWLYRAG